MSFFHGANFDIFFMIHKENAEYTRKEGYRQNTIPRIRLFRTFLYKVHFSLENVHLIKIFTPAAPTQFFSSMIYEIGIPRIRRCVFSMTQYCVSHVYI